MIFSKTKFDEDGDRVIETEPKPKYIFVELDDRFIAHSLGEGDPIDIRSLNDLANLVPNLMIPEDMLKRLSKIEMINNLESSDLDERCPVSSTEHPKPLGFGVRLNLILGVPNKVPVIDKSDNTTIYLSTYVLGNFRSPRRNVHIENDPIEFQLASGPKNLWILIDENVDKIYFYNAHDNKIIDWCLTTTSDFLSLLSIFSSNFLSDETKGDLIKAMNNIKLNYFKGIISAEKNEGLTGFLKNM